jgi:hypothetical protein
MNKTVAAAIVAIVFAGVASAHPGGHDFDDRPRYTGYDCTSIGVYFHDQGGG